MRLDGATVVLTGAGSGIGRALAQALAAKGARLLLADLNADGLEETKRLIGGDGVIVQRADITDAADRKALVQTAEGEFGRLNMLINNAGVVSVGRLSEATDAELSLMLNVNVLAPMALIRDFMPLLAAAAPAARIVNTGSMFGDIAFPLFAAYSATKFAVRGLSDALRRELEGQGIGVTYVAPRAAKTGATGAFAHLIEPMKMKLDPPEKVAAEIVAGIEKDARSVYPRGPERFFVLIQRLFPGLVDGDVVKQLAVAEKTTE